MERSRSRVPVASPFPGGTEILKLVPAHMAIHPLGSSKGGCEMWLGVFC